MKVIPQLFDPLEIEYIQELPEVQSAYKKIELGNSAVYFTIPLQDSIKAKLTDSFGLHLDSLHELPCRWIRGNTRPHIDRGRQEFQTTNLVYLTDSVGKFHIENEYYPIVAGTGFQFDEGLHHEVIDTEGTTRLLLGPMSETGFSVGSTINANGETDTVYVYYESGKVFARINNGPTTQEIQGTGTYVNNTSTDPTNNILKIIFLTDIRIETTEMYFICNTDGIQFGSDTTNPDGSVPRITVDSILNFRGLILNGDGGLQPAYASIYVKNLRIVSSGSTLQGSAGWFGSAYYGYGQSDNRFENCSSDGDISVNGGGIVGAYAGQNLGSLTIQNCSSTGGIGVDGGGIIGASAGAFGGTIVISSSFSSGTNIGTTAGGICGANAGNTNGSVEVSKCYSSGTIGISAGGIYGASAAINAGTATATICYSIGSIGAGAGGIFGADAGVNGGIDFGITNAINCYSTGDINATGGGIYGQSYSITTSSANNCYTTGILTGGNGGIFANSPTPGISNFAENGSWTDTNSTNYLLGAPTASAPFGTNWFQPNGINTAYRLSGVGKSPYTTTDTDSFSQTIPAGASSTAALDVYAGYTFSIIAINGESPSTYAGILTIDSATGKITTTSSTPVGVYLIYVYNYINPYYTSLFTLTVTAAPPQESTAGASGCCSTGSNLTFYQYRPYNEYAEGTVIVNQEVNNTRRKFGSYDLYNKFLTGLAYRR